MEYAALCGMTEDQFWNCTPRFMAAKLKALESVQQLSWEQCRYIAFHAIKPGDHKNKLKRLSDLGKFPWETMPDFAPVSREDWDDFSDEADETLKAINPALYAQYMAGKLNRNGEGVSES